MTPADSADDRIRPAATGPAPDPTRAGDDPPAVRVFLLGGPASLPRELREYSTDVDQSTIKIKFCGGYEHFERDDETVVEEPTLFRWIRRTRIAE
jgi:hypothetical protein